MTRSVVQILVDIMLFLNVWTSKILVKVNMGLLYMVKSRKSTVEGEYWYVYEREGL